jgi:hypothetical protein
MVSSYHLKVTEGFMRQFVIIVCGVFLTGGHNKAAKFLKMTRTGLHKPYLNLNVNENSIDT